MISGLNIGRESIAIITTNCRSHWHQGRLFSLDFRLLVMAALRPRSNWPPTTTMQSGIISSIWRRIPTDTVTSVEQVSSATADCSVLEDSTANINFLMTRPLRLDLFHGADGF